MDFIKDLTDIEMITRKYYELLYVNNLNNLDKTEKFLEKCNLSTHTKWTQKEKENLNSPISIEKIKIIIKNHLQW